jgi:hypothetical protein
MSTNAEIRETLRDKSLFKEFTNQEMDEFIDLLDRHEAGAGETIVKQDDLGDCMFIVVKGRARVVHHQDGHFVELAVLKAAISLANSRSWTTARVRRTCRRSTTACCCASTSARSPRWPASIPPLRSSSSSPSAASSVDSPAANQPTLHRLAALSRFAGRIEGEGFS